MVWGVRESRCPIFELRDVRDWGRKKQSAKLDIVGTIVSSERR